MAINRILFVQTNEEPDNPSVCMSIDRDVDIYDLTAAFVRFCLAVTYSPVSVRNGLDAAIAQLEEDAEDREGR